MDLNTSNSADTITPTLELPILFLNCTLEDLETSESNLGFVKESYGLVLLKKRELELLLSTRRSLVTRLNAANRQVSVLEEQLSRKEKTSSQPSNNRKYQIQTFLTLANETLSTTSSNVKPSKM